MIWLESPQLLAIFSISWPVAVFYPRVTAGGFDYYLLEMTLNFTDAERQCQELGYDGLASPSTPEAFQQALRMSQASRSIGRGIDIDLRYINETDTLQWGDGTPITSDLPWKGGQPKREAENSYGRIFWKGTLIMHSGKGRKFSLCGRDTLGKVAGTTRRGQEPDTAESPLFQSAESGYLACVHRCGEDYRCRAAAFNSDLSTCTVYGLEIYTKGTVITTRSNPRVQTFIRQAFPVGT